MIKNRNEKGQTARRESGIIFEGYPVWFDKKGYANIFFNGKSVKLHVFIWERTHGTKPKGFEIHHLDGNKANYDINNLLLVSNIDHQRIHAGWVKKDGIWIAKPCSSCKEIKALEDFYKRGKYLNKSALCKKCHRIKTSTKSYSPERKERRRIYAREWARENRKKKKELKNEKRI